MTQPTTPPPGLNSSGHKKWSAHGWHSWLMFSDFVSQDAWLDYKDDKEIGYIRSRLLDEVPNPDSIDPKFLRNLSRVLQDMQEEIDNKTERAWDR